VVAYFCTPDLTILHAVWGPESAPHFLQQATWAVELAERLRDAPAADRAAMARDAHLRNPYRTKGMWSYGGGHYEKYRHLEEKVLQPLSKTNADELFLKLVGEKASDEEVRIVDQSGFFRGSPIPSLRPRRRS
jgi:hypothetical protein